MSAQLAREVKRQLQAHGVVVHEAPGCYARGNGQTFDVPALGFSLHHTATPFGTCPAVLVNGRKDLAGPLCNTSGNADGSVTLVAAFPANHAGASGGRAMGPLPTTRSFNRIMWGHEIVYPGTVPMNPAQYRTACILGGILMGINKRRSADWCRAHAETSITGKWDPGFKLNTTYHMPRFRDDIWAALHTPAPVGAPVTPPRKGLIRMRSLNLDNPAGETPTRSGVLTIDAVGTSGLMPKGAEAYLQYHAFYPFADMTKLPPPECNWLAFCRFDGSQISAVNPFRMPMRASGAWRLPEGCASVEIAVRNLPIGGAVGWHIDGRGHVA